MLGPAEGDSIKMDERHEKELEEETSYLRKQEQKSRSVMKTNTILGDSLGRSPE